MLLSGRIRGSPTAWKHLSLAGLFLVILETGLLVIPSMERPLVERGQSTLRLNGFFMNRPFRERSLEPF
jgi:hypothetical protein